MRISYRAHGGSHDYWQRRWDGVAVDSGAINPDRYPGPMLRDGGEFRPATWDEAEALLAE